MSYDRISEQILLLYLYIDLWLKSILLYTFLDSILKSNGTRANSPAVLILNMKSTNLFGYILEIQNIFVVQDSSLIKEVTIENQGEETSCMTVCVSAPRSCV